MMTFTLTRTVTETFKAGWGVHVLPIWQGDDDTDDVIDTIEVSVVCITESAAKLVGGVWCVLDSDVNMFVPIANFLDVPDLIHDDQHDLRTRWFSSKDEADEHAKDVLATWQNPEPWRSFVTLD